MLCHPWSVYAQFISQFAVKLTLVTAVDRQWLIITKTPGAPPFTPHKNGSGQNMDCVFQAESYLAEHQGYIHGSKCNVIFFVRKLPKSHKFAGNLSSWVLRYRTRAACVCCHLAKIRGTAPLAPQPSFAPLQRSQSCFIN